ncbi:MAG TPA: putative sulfate exporter family transporter, partial [Steroidobacteraceae bacterium]
MLRPRECRWERFINKIKHITPGVLLAGALAFAAMQFAKIPWLQSNGISALTLAIVLGMLFGNTLYARIAGASAA